jgi:hypothetical protein
MISARDRLKARVIARALLPLAEERERLEGSLLKFVEAAWPSLDSSEYQSSFAIEAICDHLQAVTEGHIRKLLINCPPRSGKTLVTSVCFPAWTWARREQSYLSGPQVRFLCGSYNDDLSLQNSTKHRQLLQSPFYQKYWAKRFKMRLDQNTKSNFQNDKGGARISTSARGSLLGIGGDLILLDDPHNLTVESEAERTQALNWWKEISTTRLNNPKLSGIVVIMQRLHEEDISGAWLSSEATDDLVHLNIPMEYEWRRHCRTVLGWQDPRGLDDNGAPLVAFDAEGTRYIPAMLQPKSSLKSAKQPSCGRSASAIANSHASKRNSGHTSHPAVFSRCPRLPRVEFLSGAGGNCTSRLTASFRHSNTSLRR